MAASPARDGDVTTWPAVPGRPGRSPTQFVQSASLPRPIVATKAQIGCGCRSRRLQMERRTHCVDTRAWPRHEVVSMDSHELRQLLEAVREGRVSLDDAAHRIRYQPFHDAGGFAKVDLHRRLRCGFP